MTIWTYIRLALIVFAVGGALFAPLGPQSTPPIGWSDLAMILAFTPVGLILVFGVQAINPRSATVWELPSWRLNPFNLRQPFQFFHLGAYFFLFGGIVTLVRLVAAPIAFYPEALVPIVIGGGILIGIRLAVMLYKSKLRSDA